MNLDLIAKGFVLNPDGSYSKPKRALGAGGVEVKRVTTSNAVVATPGTRIRQSKKPLLNKLETAFWHDYLELRYPKARPQAIRFRLGNGIWYKPDFVDISVQPCKAWEVKGPHSFRGGFENLKVAASLYPEVRWILAWKEDGWWKQQVVLP